MLQCVQSSVPDRCTNPSGADCSWYVGGLEEYRPCKDSSHDYAVEYGDPFCKRYFNNYDKFTDNGKAWVDAVRKCLQES